MHKEKKSMFIISFGKPEMEEEIEEKEMSYGDKLEKEIKEEKEPKTYTKEEYGGYSPKALIEKLESVKESIANQNTREALMKIDSCIVRLTKRELPSQRKGDAFSSVDYELDKILPNQGKS
jgi:hypothetical protein